MSTKVFVAGSTGALGQPLIKQLAARGYTVYGLTRVAERKVLLESWGAQAVVADVLDSTALEGALRKVAPAYVVHALTALPKGGPLYPSQLQATNLLRTRGTANLLQAAIAAGAKRLTAESFLGIYGYANPEPAIKTETALIPTVQPQAWQLGVIDALRSMEEQLLTATRQGLIEAMPLRYGMFYGEADASSHAINQIFKRRLLPICAGAQGKISPIQIDDGANATIAALEKGQPGSIYNIVDDMPVNMNDFLEYQAAVNGAPKPWPAPGWLLNLMAPAAAPFFNASLALSNAKAKRELGWQVRYPTYREGLRPDPSTPLLRPVPAS